MNTYEILKAIAEGKITESRPLERRDLSVRSVSINKQNPEKSVVRLKFGINENSYFRIFEKKDHDYEIEFADDVYYRENHGWKGYDWDSFEDVFKDGTYFRENEFNQEQQDTYKLIISMLAPDLSSDPYSNENTSKLAEIIFKLYPRIVEEFYYREEEIRDECEIKTMKKSMVQNESNVLFKYGIYMRTPMVDYFTNVDTLISLYEKFNQEDYSIVEMLSQVVYEDPNIDRLYYDEYKYEYDCLGEFWDGESYSYAQSRFLDGIYDKVTEDFETDDKLKEYIKFFGFIISKYNFGEWYTRKAQGKVNGFDRIRIMDIDKDTLDLNVQVAKLTHGHNINIKPVKMDYDEFLNFLNLPTLFDESFGKKKTIS